MINISSEWAEVVESNNRNFSFSLVFTFADSSTLTINDKTKLLAPGLVYDSAISSDSSFDIGTAIASSLKITLNNSGGDFSDYDFTGASVALYISLELSESTETILQGLYYVDSVQDVTISKTITCLDALSLLDTYYTAGTYPQTVTAAVSEACTASGVQLSGTIPAGALNVTTAPESGYTCRDIVAAAAALSGGYAYADTNGAVKFGTFKAVTDANVDKEITRIISRTKADTETSITGVIISVDDTDYLAGAEGYVLGVTDNPLADAGNAESAAAYAWASLGNVAGVRSCEIKTPLDPAVQCGDLVKITDGAETYYCFVMALKWAFNGAMQIICKFASTKEQTSDKSNTTKVIIKKLAEEKAAEVVEAYDVAVTGLNSLAVNSLGFYETRQQQTDGSYIYYAHDAETLAESTKIYKRTADGFFFSTDGGETYTSGLTLDGSIVASVLDVIGINAEWITAESITADKIDIEDLFAQNITATNFNITGGSIAVTTDASTDDFITLTSGDYVTSLRPYGAFIRNTDTSHFMQLTADSPSCNVQNYIVTLDGGVYNITGSGSYNVVLNSVKFQGSGSFLVSTPATFSGTLTASGAKHFSGNTYVTNDDLMYFDGVYHRLQCADDNGNIFSIFNSGSDLWLGAAHGGANQHDGAVYISTGWDVSAGAPNAPYIYSFVPSSLTSGTAYETPNKGTCPWGKGSITVSAGATNAIAITKPSALVGTNPVTIVTPATDELTVYQITTNTNGGNTTIVIKLKNNTSASVTASVNYLILRN